MSISRSAYEEFHETGEYLRASEAGFYDMDEVKCEACGCVLAKDDAEKREDAWLCPECFSEVRLVEEISR